MAESHVDRGREENFFGYTRLASMKNHSPQKPNDEKQPV